MSSSTTWKPAEGGCSCKLVRYQMERSPLIVHACHCKDCQLECGTAFGLNAMIETSNLTILSDTKPASISIPAASGNDQRMQRCPKCQIVVYSHYGKSDVAAYVRVGTLDDPSVAPPDVHIYTRSKLPWLKLDGSIPERQVYYEREELWTKENLTRREELLKSSKTS